MKTYANGNTYLSEKDIKALPTVLKHKKAREAKEKTPLHMLCNSLGVTVITNFVRLATDESGWAHFEWDYLLSRNGKMLYKGEYKAGTAHAHTFGFMNKEYAPNAPLASDLLYSLLLDDTQGESFKNWCGNLGYDTDSRKAKKIYMQCQEIGDMLAANFKREELAELREAAQDF